MSGLSRGRSRDVMASSNGPSKELRVKSTKQRSDNQKRKSKDLDYRVPNRQPQSADRSTNRNIIVGDNPISTRHQVSRSKSSQVFIAQECMSWENKREKFTHKSSFQQPPVTRSKYIGVQDTKPRSNNLSGAIHGGYSMHRSTGMFDLSNIHACSGPRGSVYDLLEEFKKQVESSEMGTPAKIAEPSKVLSHRDTKHDGECTVCITCH